MAVTSIWSIKGWIGKVIKYAENPDKTKENNEGQISENQSQSTQGLEDVITYAVNTEKTRRGQSESMERELVGESEELMEQYVSGVNCAPTTAREEMIAVKKRFGKEDGIVAFHRYQSFAPGECNPEMAHEIGKKLAEELWGSQYQVLIATHLDKANHLHNHFVVNSVSFLDGKRYHRTNQDYRDMRMVSDRLCKEYQLSVVQQPEQGKGKHYAEWQAEQQGKPSYHSMVKADVDEAIRKARTEKQFFFYLREKGYSFKFGKDITIPIANTARDMGGEDLRDFLVKQLNMWMQWSNSLYIKDIKDWKRCAVLKSLKDFRGSKCYVGVDLSSGGDLTSIAIVIPYMVDGMKKYFVHTHSFIPASRVDDHIKTDKVPYDVWIAKGLVTVTETLGGIKTDYKYIIKYLEDLIKLYELKPQLICYDPHNASAFLSDLEALGFDSVSITQTAKELNDATVDFRLEVRAGNVEIEGVEVGKDKKKVVPFDELLTWSIANAKTISNSYGVF